MDERTASKPTCTMAARGRRERLVTWRSTVSASRFKPRAQVAPPQGQVLELHAGFKGTALAPTIQEEFSIFPRAVQEWHTQAAQSPSADHGCYFLRLSIQPATPFCPSCWHRAASIYQSWTIQGQSEDCVRTGSPTRIDIERLSDRVYGRPRTSRGPAPRCACRSTL